MVPRATAELEPARGVFGRIRARVEGWLRQMLSPLDIAVSGGWGTRVWPSYNPRRALSAMAAFPWVRAAVRAKCDDVGGLPLRAVRGPEDAEERVPDHPFLALIKKPSPGVTKTVLIRQLEADLSLTGDLYLWLREMGPGDFELHRLHPNHISAEIAQGQQVGWRYGELRLSLMEVFHTHDISWNDDLTMLFGESAIRTLHDGLLGVQAYRRHAAQAADKGRPDVILTIDSTSAGTAATNTVRDAYEENAHAGKRAFVVNKGVQVQTVSWAPADLEGIALDDKVRDETIAVLRVPPTRVGIPQANFATARAELQDYWNSLIVSDLQLIAEVFTSIAHVVGGSLDTEIRWDTSGVAVLQTSHDQKQARAGFWVTVMGADPYDAAVYEGIPAPPVKKGPLNKGTDTAPTKHPAKPEKDLARQAQLERVLTAWLRLAARRMEGDCPDAVAESYGLAGVLQMAGLPVDQARELGREVAAIVCEVAMISDGPLFELYPFSQSYAQSVAQRACRPRLE